MWIIKKLSEIGASIDDLLSTYILRIRIHIEQNCPRWMFSLTQELSNAIEKVQKTALYIILGIYSHRDYYCNLAILDLEPLDQRRNKIAKNFASKIIKHPAHKNIFKIIKLMSRSGKRVVIPKCRTARYEKSTVPSLAKLINKELNHKLE